MNGTRRPAVHVVFALTILMIVGAGCGLTGGSGGSSAHLASAGPTASPTNSTDDEARHDLTDEKPVDWVRYEIASPRRLRMFYLTGDPKCFGARTVVRQTATEVAVAVIVGALPDSPKICSAIGRDASLLVTLDAPLAGRWWGGGGSGWATMAQRGTGDPCVLCITGMVMRQNATPGELDGDLRTT